MSVLFSIPQVIATEVLSQWCKVCDLVNLDSACCNEIERPQLLSVLLRPPTFKLLDKIEYPLATYCKYRKLRIFRLTIQSVSNHPAKLNRILSLQHCCTNVHSLVLSLTTGDTLEAEQFDVFLKCINKCKTLKNLKLIDLGKFQGFVVGINASVLYPLRTLQLSNFSMGSSISPDAWLHMATHCTKLETLYITGNLQSQVNISSVLKLFGHDQIKLIKLANSSFLHSARFWHGLIKLTTNLSQVCIHSRMHINLPGVAALVVNNKQLSKVEIFYSASGDVVACSDECIKIFWRDPNTVINRLIYSESTHHASTAALVNLFSVINGMHSIKLYDVLHVSETLVGLIADSNPRLSTFHVTTGGDYLVNIDCLTRMMKICPIIDMDINP